MTDAQRFITVAAVAVICFTMYQAPWVTITPPWQSKSGVIDQHSPSAEYKKATVFWVAKNETKLWELRVPQLCMEWIGIGLVYAGLFLFFAAAKIEHTDTRDASDKSKNTTTTSNTTT